MTAAMDEGIRSPVLVVVSGPAGCGKTTLARALARRLRTPYVDYDTASEPFIRAALARDAETDFSAYARAFRDTAYRAVLDLAFENISLGLSVIVSGSFAKESADPGFFEELAGRYGARYTSAVVEVVLSEAELKRRLRERGSDRDNQKFERWDDFAADLGSRRPSWRPDFYVRADERRKRPLAEVVAEVSGRLNAILV